MLLYAAPLLLIYFIIKVIFYSLDYLKMNYKKQSELTEKHLEVDKKCVFLLCLNSFNKCLLKFISFVSRYYSIVASYQKRKKTP